jgi:predicted  nucleic acid-binding Zn-ribbon protein
MLSFSSLAVLPEIRQLVNLQAVEQRIAALEAEITALPKKLAAQDAKLAAAKTVVANVEAALKDEEKTRRRLQDEVRDHRDKADKYRAQTNSVKTNEQLHALQHEIEFAEKSIGQTEDRELSSMETTERLEADLIVAKNGLRDQTQNAEWEKASAMKVSERDQQELKKLRGERAQLREAADAELLANYDRLAKSKKTAMAEVKDRQCLACHMGLRPAQWQQVLSGAQMHCESCGRLWYYDAGNDEKLAAKEAGQWDMP